MPLSNIKQKMQCLTRDHTHDCSHLEQVLYHLRNPDPLHSSGLFLNFPTVLYMGNFIQIPLDGLSYGQTSSPSLPRVTLATKSLHELKNAGLDWGLKLGPLTLWRTALPTKLLTLYFFRRFTGFSIIYIRHIWKFFRILLTILECRFIS